MAFVHLRTHTEFSVADGTLRIADAVDLAAADGQVQEHRLGGHVLDGHDPVVGDGLHVPGRPDDGGRGYDRADHRHPQEDPADHPPASRHDPMVSSEALHRTMARGPRRAMIGR